MKRVLITDDEEALLAVFSSILTSAGFEVAAAADGRQALDICARSNEPFDVLLCDLHLSGMSAKDVVGRVRKCCPEIRVVLMSGVVDSEDVGAWCPKATPTLEKPFTLPELLSAI